MARFIGGGCEEIQVHRFPDGESLLRLPPRLPAEVILCRSLDHPNDKLVELMLAADTARDLGAERVTLVAPYLCYMRQDIAFNPGEAVSQRILGARLEQWFDRIITVDPHLHRTEKLGDVFPHAETRCLTAAPLMGRYLTGQLPDALLIGPDAESLQWVRAISQVAGFPHAVAEKTRRGDRTVEIRLPDNDYTGRVVVLVDDIVSSGCTLATAAHAVKARGACRVICLVTHPLFSSEAPRRLASAGVDQIWSSDSIPHSSNSVPLAPLLADAACGKSD